MCEKRDRVEWYRDDGRKVTRTRIRCSCGELVVCGRFTNACQCGADYDMSGTRLADRSQWGAETGESVSDILAADSADALESGGW